MTLLPFLEANRIEAGCDEVGRGCLAGPVVAAAVILPQDYRNPWVKDSKKLSKKTREDLIQEIKNSGRDAILTIAIIDQTNETRYVPGTTSYSPMYYGGGYGRFGGYYGMYGPTTYSPGYYTTDKNYFIEINLYDLGTQALVWSAQSSTTNPTNINNASQEFAYVVVDKMIKDKIIIPKK